MSLDVPVYDPQKRQAQPKPAKGTQRKAKRKAQRTDAQRLKAWRDAIWARERAKLPFDCGNARCQECGCWVFRGIDPASSLAGECDHIIPRSLCTRAQRYDHENGQLLCKQCHAAKRTQR